MSVTIKSKSYQIYNLLFLNLEIQLIMNLAVKNKFYQKRSLVELSLTLE